MTVIPMTKDQDMVSIVWQTLREEARDYAKSEPALSSLLHATILDQKSICRALAAHLAAKLATPELTALHLQKLLRDIYCDADDVVESAVLDLVAVRERDPACTSYLQCFLYFSGFMSLQTYRSANKFWQQDRKLLAYHLQSRSVELFGVDIHPAAAFGSGLMLDHATSIVAGETSVVGDNCSILHGVTLGGTGKSRGDRHPKIGKNVLIGAGATILGNITVGDGARIAAGSVVLKDVQPQCTVAGVPAKPIGGPCCDNPAAKMDQILDETDE